MAQRVRLLTTSFEGLRPLAFQGVQASTCYAQFTSLLSSTHLSHFSGLLAEPLADSKRGCIDWYSNADTPPVSYTALNADQQNTVKEQLSAALQQITEFAQQLAAQADSNSRMAGNLLSFATTYPNDECIYLVDGAPVLVCWGYAQDSIVTVPQPPKEDEQAAPVEHSPTVEPTPSRSFPWRWLLYLFFSFFAVLIVLALLYYFVPRIFDEQKQPSEAPLTVPSDDAKPSSPTAPLSQPKGGAVLPSQEESGKGWWEFILPSGCSAVLPRGCTVQPSVPQIALPVLNATLQVSLDTTASLQQELAALQLEYKNRLALCPRPAPTSQPEAQPELPPKQDPLAELGLVQPEVTPLPEPIPRPAPLPPKEHPKPAPKKEKPQQKDVLDIPPDATDLAFLEGCWYANIGAGLTSKRTGLPVSVKFCFGETGRGSSLIQEFSKQGKFLGECSGSATASLSKNSLTIKDGGSVTCPDGRKYGRNIVQCRQSKGAALCSDITGDKRFSNIRFTKTGRYSAPPKAKKK